MHARLRQRCKSLLQKQVFLVWWLMTAPEGVMYGDAGAGAGAGADVDVDGGGGGGGGGVCDEAKANKQGRGLEAMGAPGDMTQGTGTARNKRQRNRACDV